MKLTDNADLRPYNSFGVAARAACLAEIEHGEELEPATALAKERGLPVLLLGGGTNVLFAGDFPGLVLLMRNRGVEIDRESGVVRAAAGENWHDLVRACLRNGLYGLENLALIPGSAGAAPVQNIGAYGVELESFFVGLELFDCADSSLREMSREDCKFSYRDSVLKQSQVQSRLQPLSPPQPQPKSPPQPQPKSPPQPQPRVVCSLTLQLSREPAPNLSYPALAEELEGIAEPKPQDVFEAVCRIRCRKLPDPAEIGNAGSFFKNPIISQDEFEQLSSRYHSPPSFPAKEGVKVPAGWLLDQCGFKGYEKGAAGVYERHALILVNRGGATGRELHQLAMEMRDSVHSEFGIILEPEVRIIAAE